MKILRLIRLPDIVTVVNALLGFTAVLMALEGMVSDAFIVILVAAMADGVDGVLARSVEYGELGEDLDSLADLLSFGLAPAIAAYMSLRVEMMVPATIIGAGFFVAGMLRLARFNVYGGGESFQGIPITAGGMAVAAFGLFVGGNLLLPIMVVLAFAMMSTVEYPKPRSKVVIVPLAVLLTAIVAAFYLGLDFLVSPLAGVLSFSIMIYLLSPLIGLVYGYR